MCRYDSNGSILGATFLTNDDPGEEIVFVGFLSRFLIFLAGGVTSGDDVIGRFCTTPTLPKFQPVLQIALDGAIKTQNSPGYEMEAQIGEGANNTSGKGRAGRAISEGPKKSAE